jgi:hypothetical protein
MILAQWTMLKTAISVTRKATVGVYPDEIRIDFFVILGQGNAWGVSRLLTDQIQNLQTAMSPVSKALSAKVSSVSVGDVQGWKGDIAFSGEGGFRWSDLPPEARQDPQGTAETIAAALRQGGWKVGRLDVRGRF